MGVPPRREVVAYSRGKLLIFVGRRPAAYFVAVLINEPHRFRRYLLQRPLNPDVLSLWMIGAVKSPDPGMG